MPAWFLYRDDAPWIAGCPASPATAKGGLWWSSRGSPVLVPGPGKVEGLLVDAPPERSRVLEMLYGGGVGIGPRWASILVSAGLRPMKARAWLVPDARTARLAGLRPPRGWT